MKLSESLAGVTLLSISNGASDVITVLVASSDEGGDSLVMGSLFGASIFTTTICLGIIVLSAAGGEGVKNLKRIRFPTILVTYLIASVILLIAGNYYVPYLYIGLIFMTIYIIYVFIIHFQDEYIRK